MNDFTVMTGNKDMTDLSRLTRLIVLQDLWEKQYRSTIKRASGKSIEEWSQDELMKVALCGIKYISCYIDIKAENEKLHPGYQTPFTVTKAAFQSMDALYDVIGHIKLSNLIQTFPITKEYDGEKWGCKDYFFTMNVLKEKGLDNAVGRNAVFDLLWDYQNKDLYKTMAFYMSCASALYRQKTGVSIAEKFCEDNGIGTYTMDQENGLLFDNQRGEIVKLEKKPSYMQVVK